MLGGDVGEGVGSQTDLQVEVEVVVQQRQQGALLLPLPAEDLQEHTELLRKPAEEEEERPCAIIDINTQYQHLDAYQLLLSISVRLLFTSGCSLFTRF